MGSHELSRAGGCHGPPPGCSLVRSLGRLGGVARRPSPSLTARSMRGQATAGRRYPLRSTGVSGEGGRASLIRPSSSSRGASHDCASAVPSVRRRGGRWIRRVLRGQGAGAPAARGGGRADDDQRHRSPVLQPAAAGGCGRPARPAADRRPTAHRVAARPGRAGDGGGRRFRRADAHLLRRRRYSRAHGLGPARADHRQHHPDPPDRGAGIPRGRGEELGRGRLRARPRAAPAGAGRLDARPGGAAGPAGPSGGGGRPRPPRDRRAAAAAGPAGGEPAAQLQGMPVKRPARSPRLSRAELRWVLIDLAPAVLPEMGPRLSRAALDVVRRRGMEVRLETTVTAMDDDGVTLDDGSRLPTRTVLWTVGVTPPPLVAKLGLPVNRGRLVVDDELRLRDGVWAAGDSAAAPDPFSEAGHDYPPTAQHAQRQGVVIGRNIAASLGHGSPRPYRHRDLGLVADLGRTAAVARPLGLSLTGLPAKVVTKAYHLYALPAGGNRVRVAGDWMLNLISQPIAAQLGLVAPAAARLSAEGADPARRSEAAPDGGDPDHARRTATSPRSSTA